LRRVKADIARRRLRAQQLAAPTFARPVDAVSWFGAVQAQDYLGALWAVGLRVKGAHEGDVERALTDGTLVRSWPMRGTLHLMAAQDARWMIALLAPRASAAAAGRLRSLGTAAKLLSRARRALVPRLEGGRRLTRPAAYARLEEAGVTTEAGRGLQVLWCLAHEGLVCLGPRQGKQHTFVLLEEWAPRTARFSREEALAELARRYFTSHGPATLRDFAWWSGVTLADAGKAVNGAGRALRDEAIDGHRFWSASAAPTGARAVPGHALPAFDEFFVGYADRRAAIDPAHADRLTAFDVLSPVVLVGGRLVARWKRATTRDRVICSLSPLAPLRGSERRIVHGALERYARFLGVELAIEDAPAGRGGASPR
jgi:hypothetical protein